MSYYDWTFGGLCLQNAGLVLRLVSWTFESLVSLITPHYPLRSPSWSTVLHFRCVRLSFQKKTRVSCCCFRVFVRCRRWSPIKAAPSAKELAPTVRQLRALTWQEHMRVRANDLRDCAFLQLWLTGQFVAFRSHLQSA